MPLIDSHAHLTYSDLADQIGEVIDRAREAGVSQVITIGTDVSEARKAIAMTEKFPGFVRAAVGFHPHGADKVSPGDLEEMSRLVRDPAVVGFGEMGLDYHYNFGSRDRQHEVFRAQLRVAADLDRTVIIHSREACDDTIAILSEHGFDGRRVVFHCFTGTSEEAAKIADHGWRISFTGIVTFKSSAELQAIAKAYPADQIMVETDSPYLSPEPVRSKRPNEPAHVAHTARFLAKLRGEEFETFVEMTAANTRKFFGL